MGSCYSLISGMFATDLCRSSHTHHLNTWSPLEVQSSRLQSLWDMGPGWWTQVPRSRPLTVVPTLWFRSRVLSLSLSLSLSLCFLSAAMETGCCCFPRLQDGGRAATCKDASRISGTFLSDNPLSSKTWLESTSSSHQTGSRHPSRVPNTS